MNPNSKPFLSSVTRRRFLASCGVAAASNFFAGLAFGEPTKKTDVQQAAPKETYETHAKGIRILPGQWRPHYPFEQIAWISPAWPSQDYLWLDFPEAIFVGKELIFLSHVNPAFPNDFTNLPKVPWRETPGGIAFERTLPNGVRFGGSLVKGKDPTVEMELHLHNGGKEPLEQITLQTCAYLRAIKEFADYTRDNKFVHHPTRGWINMTEARTLPDGAGPYRLGWRTKGTPLADLPIAICVSNQGSRLMAMTWFSDTLSLVSNPNHPCLHADPKFKDLQPGESATIRGRLGFYESRLEDFDPQAFLAT